MNAGGRVGDEVAGGDCEERRRGRRSWRGIKDGEHSATCVMLYPHNGSKPVPRSDFRLFRLRHMSRLVLRDLAWRFNSDKQNLLESRSQKTLRACLFLKNEFIESPPHSITIRSDFISCLIIASLKINSCSSLSYGLASCLYETHMSVPSQREMKELPWRFVRGDTQRSDKNGCCDVRRQ